jgi:hypothetical protein
MDCQETSIKLALRTILRTGADPAALEKFFIDLLKPKAVLLIFSLPPNGGVRAPRGPGQ